MEEETFQTTPFYFRSLLDFLKYTLALYENERKAPKIKFKPLFLSESVKQYSSLCVEIAFEDDDDASMKKEEEKS